MQAAGWRYTEEGASPLPVRPGALILTWSGPDRYALCSILPCLLFRCRMRSANWLHRTSAASQHDMHLSVSV